MLLEEKDQGFLSAQAGKVLTPGRVLTAEWSSSVELATQCLGRSDTLLRDPRDHDGRGCCSVASR